MSASLWMLDTNTVSYLVREKDSRIRARLNELPITRVCISVITEAELRFGLQRKPEATCLKKLIDAFLATVTCMTWNADVAIEYARLRTLCEGKGKPLGGMDMLIAAHAITADATLVTCDNGFKNAEDLISLENWHTD